MTSILVLLKVFTQKREVGLVQIIDCGRKQGWVVDGFEHRHKLDQEPFSDEKLGEVIKLDQFPSWTYVTNTCILIKPIPALIKTDVSSSLHATTAV